MDPRFVSALRIQAVVEVPGESTEVSPARLLAMAYRASRHGTVLLVLRGLSRSAADRLLDPIVSAVGAGVFGVLYLDEHEEAEAVDAARHAAVAIAATNGFYTRLLAAGAHAVRAAEVPRDLEEWPGETRRA